MAGSRRLALVALSLALVAAACGFGPQVALRTARAPAQACMDALLTGVLTRHAPSGLGVAHPDGGTTTVEWPFGYSARDEAGRVALLDATGKVVAREGDRIAIGGGLGDEVWYACGPVEVVGS